MSLGEEFLPRDMFKTENKFSSSIVVRQNVSGMARLKVKQEVDNIAGLFCPIIYFFVRDFFHRCQVACICTSSGRS